MRKYWRIALIVVATALALACVLIAMFLHSLRTGSHFDPTDPQDIIRLRQIADTAKPLMVAAEDYHRAHGKYPAELQILVHIWYYNQTSDQEFQLYKKVGWDSALFYEGRPDGSSRWYYDPGDGSPTTDLNFRSSDQKGP